MTPFAPIPRSHSFWRRQWGALRKRWLRLRHGEAHFLATYLGAQFACRLDDGVAKGMALNTYDHRQITRLMAWSRMEKPSLFIDIGANLGLYSCILVKNGCVPEALAFEPDRGNAQALTENIERNRLSGQIRIAQVALGAQEGEAWLAEGPHGNRGTSRLMDPDTQSAGNDAARGDREVAAAGTARYQVPLRRLDAMLDLRDACLMIKIDVEGREAGVLAGMADLLAGNRGLIQIEAFDEAYRQALETAGFVYRGSIACDHFWEKT
jgi:FkbM family methyltransferase